MKPAFAGVLAILAIYIITLNGPSISGMVVDRGLIQCNNDTYVGDVDAKTRHYLYNFGISIHRSRLVTEGVSVLKIPFPQLGWRNKISTRLSQMCTVLFEPEIQPDMYRIIDARTGYQRIERAGGRGSGRKEGRRIEGGSIDEISPEQEPEEEAESTPSAADTADTTSTTDTTVGFTTQPVDLPPAPSSLGGEIDDLVETDETPDVIVPDVGDEVDELADLDALPPDVPDIGGETDDLAPVDDNGGGSFDFPAPPATPGGP